jgi:hypothetical protein
MFVARDLFVAFHPANPGNSLSFLAFPKAHLMEGSYHGTLVHMKELVDTISIERIQTGVRIEKGLLKVLKALAELKDMSLGDLLEGIVLHAFEGKAPFSSATLEQIDQFRKIYGVTLRATDSHRLKERK